MDEITYKLITKLPPEASPHQDRKSCDCILGQRKNVQVFWVLKQKYVYWKYLSSVGPNQRSVVRPLLSEQSE